MSLLVMNGPLKKTLRMIPCPCLCLCPLRQAIGHGQGQGHGQRENLEIARINPNVHNAAAYNHIETELLAACNESRALGAGIEPNFPYGLASNLVNDL